MRAIRRLAIAPALLPALLVAACGHPAADDAPLIVSAIGPAAAPANPSRGPLDTPARLLMDATAQGLVRFDAAGQIEAGLAERWIVIDDGRSYIFRLREAQWPDGEPVTAEQVVRVLRRATAGGSRNALAPFLAVIDEIVEMTPQVIEVRLKRPRPDLLKLFAQPELAIFETRKLGGSGPFRIHDEHDGVLLRAIPDPARGDPDSGEAPPQRQVRLRGERAALALARYAARRADLVLGGGMTDWPLVGAAGIDAANVRIDPAQGLFGLAVARREGFLGDAANRAAIAMAIDRAALTASFRGDWSPIETVLPEQLDSAAPPTVPGWQPLSLDQRRAAARDRVAAWRSGHPDPITIRIALPAGPGATLLWGQLARGLLAIGLAPERVAFDTAADLRLVDAVAPYDSGRWFLVRACQPCADAAATLIAEARDAATLDARAHRIAEAEAALAADYAYIPIARPLRWSIVGARASAWQGNRRAWHPLNHVRNDGG